MPTSAAIAIPEAQILLPRSPDWKIQRLILDDLKTAKQTGIGFLVSAPKPADLPLELAENTASEITVVSQNDVGIRIENKKPYRCLLRPTLSQFSG